jgi:hypothetical protein
LPEPQVRALPPTLRQQAEVDLCDTLAEWLRGLGWETFFEVPLGRGRPDVVGVRAEETLAIEAKLLDVSSVLRQGLRIARLVRQPYIALPPPAAGEAGVALEVLARRRPGLTLPGLLAVTRQVRELRPPRGQPSRAVSADELRRLGQVHGAWRGGRAGGDRIERNLRLWVAAAQAPDLASLAADFAMERAAARQILIRLRAARRHLEECQRPMDECPAGAIGRLAHRHATTLLSLPALPLASWRRLGIV